jgi:hypothetical protein
MLNVAIRIAVGNRNEDRAAHPRAADQDLLLLADGAGGLSGGVAAAELALNAFASVRATTSTVDVLSRAPASRRASSL